MTTDHAPTARTREKPSGEEEATADLKLGEFEGVPTLTISEARVLINAVVSHRRAHKNEAEPENLTKTRDYLEIFARFKQPEALEAVERMLMAKTELEAFERSQLGTLCLDSADEARTLIPSLSNKISESDLQELLDDIVKLRNFVE
ncbi:MAG: hypothetical protein LQ346_005363 [Caloplaca aetnensis]|nr:MAG: hypothetical protein LQ346_005363 [Caloplaca aetnensis]